MTDVLIRHATLDDLPALASVEAACFPPSEAASEDQLARRVQAYPDTFWLLVNDDPSRQEASFPAQTEDGALVGFLDGMLTNSADLDDSMYQDTSAHDPDGAWLMVLGLDVAPVYQHRGCAHYLMRKVIEDCRNRGLQGMVLTCKTKLVDFYKSFDFEDEGMSESTHGHASWHQMRLSFTS